MMCFHSHGQKRKKHRLEATNSYVALEGSAIIRTRFGFKCCLNVKACLSPTVVSLHLSVCFAQGFSSPALLIFGAG